MAKRCCCRRQGPRGRDPPPRGGAGAGRRADGRRHDEPQAADRSQRPPVRGGQRDGGAARAGEQGGDKALFDDGGDGHVEQDEHRPGAERLVLGDGCGRRGPQAGPRHRGGLRGFTGEPLQECREIAAGPVERGQQRRRHGGHLQLVQRARGGAREARRPGHRREGPQRALLDRVEPGARDNRFRTDGAGRRQPLPREPRQRESHHQLDDAGADDAEQTAAHESRRGRAFVRRAPGMRHEQAGMAGRGLRQCGDGRLQARLGCGRADHDAGRHSGRILRERVRGG